MIEKNAIIRSAEIDVSEDYLGVIIKLDYGGVTQGFGTYSLYSPYSSPDFPENKMNYAGIFLWKCMKIAGASNWSQMVGKAIRVRKKSELDLIDAIGHIIKDQWFCPKEEFGVEE